VSSGKLLATIDGPSREDGAPSYATYEVLNLAYSQNGSRLAAVTENDIKLIDPTTGTLMEKLSASGGEPEFSLDSNHLFLRLPASTKVVWSNSEDGNAVARSAMHLRIAKEDSWVQVVRVSEEPLRVCFVPSYMNANGIVTASGRRVAVGGPGGTVLLFDISALMI